MKLRSQNYIVIVISTLHHNHVRWQLTRVVGTFGAAAFGENPFERPDEYLLNLMDETLIVAFGLQNFYLLVSKTILDQTLFKEKPCQGCLFGQRAANHSGWSDFRGA